MKNFFLSVILAVALLAGCKSSTNNEQAKSTDTVQDSTQIAGVYICPCGGCPEIRESKPGNCSKCEMPLVPEKASADHTDHAGMDTMKMAH
jgi:hypothetical protein